MSGTGESHYERERVSQGVPVALAQREQNPQVEGETDPQGDHGAQREHGQSLPPQRGFHPVLCLQE